MGFFSDRFGPPKPQPVVIIKDRLGKKIDRVEGGVISRTKIYAVGSGPTSI